MKEKIDRREFMHQAGRAAAGLALGAGALGAGSCTRARKSLAQAPSEPPRREEQSLRLGFIGVGGRGRQLLGHFVEMPLVEIKALCDVHRGHLREALRITDRGPELYGEHEKLLEREDIDAVVVATPDHWHAIIAIDACKAGKDVYVEKPLALCVAEGRGMVEAARKHGRIVQMGSQQRSGPHYQVARDLIQGGRIGKVTVVRAWNFRNRHPGFGFPPDSEPPEGLDWERWLGPRPLVPYNRVKAGGSFRQFWEYSGGILTDWGTHHFDSIQMIMGAEGPTSAMASGGKYVIDDLSTVPDTLSVLYQYPDWTLEYSSREANGKAPYGSEYGIEFYGVEGTMYLDRSGYRIVPEKESEGEEIVFGTPGVDNFVPPALDRAHIADFLDAVRTRRAPNTEVEIGHRSTIVSHLGNIALRTGRRIEWDAEGERIVGDREADGLLRREYRRPYLLREV